MSAIFPCPESLTLESFLEKYPKLKPGFRGFAFIGTFLGAPDPELSEAEESKSEESTSDLNLLGVMKTLYQHLHKRWPSADGAKFVSPEELACLKEFVAIQNLNAYVHSAEEFSNIMLYFERISCLYLSMDSSKLRYLKLKLESLADSMVISEGEDLLKILCWLSETQATAFFEKNRELYLQENALIQLKIAASLSRWDQDLSLALISRINFSQSMPTVTVKDIELVLNNLSVRSLSWRKDYAWTFRLHKIGGSNSYEDDDFYPPKELSFFALRLPILGAVGAEAVAEFATHKKTICQNIKSIPELGFRIQILHALIYEKGSIGYEGIRVKRGIGPFSKACSFFTGQLGAVFTTYQESIKQLMESESLSVLQDTLTRFQESGMSEVPEALTRKIRELNSREFSIQTPTFL